jgi:hypothetical protein
MHHSNPSQQNAPQPPRGSYDVFRHEYAAPPSDARFRHQEDLTERRAFISGHGLRRVPLPARQGVYDPIKGTWVVPPRDARCVRGLEFAPRGAGSSPGGEAAAHGRGEPPQRGARGGEARGTFIFARRNGGSPSGGLV